VLLDPLRQQALAFFGARAAVVRLAEQISVPSRSGSSTAIALTSATSA
jgi:hypothetical protein